MFLFYPCLRTRAYWVREKSSLFPRVLVQNFIFSCYSGQSSLPEHTKLVLFSLPIPEADQNQEMQPRYGSDFLNVLQNKTSDLTSMSQLKLLYFDFSWLFRDGTHFQSLPLVSQLSDIFEQWPRECSGRKRMTIQLDHLDQPWQSVGWQILQTGQPSSIVCHPSQRTGFPLCGQQIIWSLTLICIYFTKGDSESSDQKYYILTLRSQTQSPNAIFYRGEVTSQKTKYNLPGITQIMLALILA